MKRKFTVGQIASIIACVAVIAAFILRDLGILPQTIYRIIIIAGAVVVVASLIPFNSNKGGK